MKNNTIENLTKSEIKRAIRYAEKRDLVKCTATGWATHPQNTCDKETGFQTVSVEIMSADMEDVFLPVYISVCLWDRRRSFIMDGAESWYRDEPAEETATNNNNTEEENTMTASKTMMNYKPEAECLSYEEFQKLAMENYTRGGDVVVECWGRQEFDEYVKQFGAIGEGEAFRIFELYKSNEEEEESMARWMSGEGNNGEDTNLFKVVAVDSNGDEVLTYCSGLTLRNAENVMAGAGNSLWIERVKYDLRIVPIAEGEEAGAEGEAEPSAENTERELYEKVYNMLFDCVEDFERDYDKIMNAIADHLGLSEETFCRIYDEFKPEFDLYCEVVDPDEAEEENDEPTASEIVEAVAEKVEQVKPRSAWDSGVKEYAAELLDGLREGVAGGWLDETDFSTRKLLEKAMLNGAGDWKQYSEGGCALIYGGQIAERLCAPWELRKTDNGRKDPNPRESWIDVQSRALFQASEMILRAAF